MGLVKAILEIIQTKHGYLAGPKQSVAQYFRRPVTIMTQNKLGSNPKTNLNYIGPLTY